MKLIDKYVDVLDRHYNGYYRWPIGRTAAEMIGWEEEFNLFGINRLVNKRLKYKSDRLLHGVRDKWDTPTEALEKGAGDCEEYGLTKGLLGAAIGLKPRFAVVKDRWQWHAVCIIDDYVLDITSRSPVRPWTLDKYQMLGVYTWYPEHIFDVPSEETYQQMKKKSTDIGFLLSQNH